MSTLIQTLDSLQCPIFNGAFVDWLNTLKDNQQILCEAIENVQPVVAATLTQPTSVWTTVGQVVFMDQTYVRQFVNSQLLITVNFNSMIEAEVGPPDGDSAMNNIFTMSLGSGAFSQIGRNFINSTVTGLDNSDSVSEETGIGYAVTTTGSGNLRIRLRRNPTLFQGSNMRGREDNIVISIIEIGV